MKQIKFILFALTLGATSIMISSCNSDECKDKDCGTTGICQDGTCICDAGYEVDAVSGKCTVESRLKFIGNYHVTEDGSMSLPGAYDVKIEASGTDVNKVLISNVWGTFLNKTIATVSGSTITIARQEPDGDDFFVEGEGTISGTVITMNYKVTDETGSPIKTDQFTSSVWTKF